jgi:hypothetical protein
MSGYESAGTPGPPGEDGAPGAVQTVAGQPPDGMGDVPLTVADIVGAAAAADVAADLAAAIAASEATDAANLAAAIAASEAAALGIFMTLEGGNEFATTIPAAGDVGWFPNTGLAAPVLAAEDYILIQPFAKNSAVVPRVWAMNPVIVKDQKHPTALNALCIGLEISATNDTDEAADPTPTGANGALIGLYVSYINTVNQGSAAAYITGIAAGALKGWKHGVWIDGITTGGTGVSLHNDVGANAMAVGIDTTDHAGNFSIAAILLGNAHRLSAKKVGGAVRELIYMNGADVLVVGDANTQDYIMRFFAQSYEFSGIATAGAATAGAAGAPPAQVAQYMPVKVAGTNYKIPLYNV